MTHFQTAVDVIVNGDIATLRTLLNENPDLVRERATQEHRSTLLHYVSANGVEDFLQKTPPNIVEITKLLLEAGADVNAESDAYGGHSTPLGLTATSCHPEAAGVQLPLMELLLEHGAAVGDNDVVTCLRNGRGQAAEFLASRGAHLDLEGAAGLGRLALVQNLFDTATDEQLTNGFSWACEFGRTSVVEFLLQKGVRIGNGLHWAAHSGHVDIVKLLLEHGAPVDVKDERHHATPLEWARHARGNREDEVSTLLLTHVK